MRHREDDNLRAKLQQLVDDVEPRPDALPRLLVATRRRRRPYLAVLRLIAGAGAAVGATALLLVALLGIPGQPQNTTPVSVRPDSYVAQAEPGVIAAFDVSTGRQIGKLGTVAGAEGGTLTADGDQVYTTVAKADGREILKLSPNGEVEFVKSSVPSDVLAARGGRLAYPADDAVVVLDGKAERRVPIPMGRVVVDLALDRDGRLAVVTRPEGKQAKGTSVLYVVEPGATERSRLPLTRECGPLAITWSGTEVTALMPTQCGSTRVRVSTLNRTTGQQVGAGVPFDVRAELSGRNVELSADPLGRFLVSASNSGQWIVDGATVRSIPPACSPEGNCAGAPGTFWGR